MAIIEEVVENSDITETVEKLKQEGNACFGQGEWSAAAEKYKEALNICPPENDSLRSVLLSNLSAALIKQTKWEAAAEAATEAIEGSYPICIFLSDKIALTRSRPRARPVEHAANAPNEKPLERRAFAYSNIPQKYQNAIDDYEKLKEQFPQRTQYSTKIQELQKKIEIRNEEMKNEMISKLKELGNVCLRPFGLSTDSFQLTPNADGGYSISMKNSGAQPEEQKDPV
ncbi:tetratricopeptide repeat protein [Ancylostoma ceylanicum]|uniref:Tetratricopeptide repeat protein n=1 Tax=Ancylostoma ceylanicum TaxID=53326 RepID=A0A0D6LSX6_9BILA|nr:tetratricopeptide repeat protein [Ancylostoma ceylanicum]